MSSSEAPKRRHFTAEYKQAILEKLDACAERGARTQVLQEEELLWSHVAKWRRQREAGLLDDSWSELSSLGRLDLLLQEREALLEEIDQLRIQNDRLRRQVGEALAPPRLRDRLSRLFSRQRGGPDERGSVPEG